MIFLKCVYIFLVVAKNSESLESESGRVVCSQPNIDTVIYDLRVYQITFSQHFPQRWQYEWETIVLIESPMRLYI
jgi:hypothetical protein